MRRLLLFLFLIAIPGTGLASQLTNLERLRDCARILSDSILTSGISVDTVGVAVASHPASWLVEGEFLRNADVRQTFVATYQSGGRRDVMLAITGIGIVYRPIDDDRLERIASLQLDASLPHPLAEGSAEGRRARTFSVTLSDTVEVDQTSLLESPGYDFARGTHVAGASGGFWQNVVEPAVVIGSAVVMVILLFTVRSQ